MVSKGAQKLYDYMVKNAVEHERLIYYDGSEQFQKDYKVWLTELMAWGWVKEGLVLGTLQRVLYRDTCREVKQDRLLGRYPPEEQSVLKMALELFGGKRQSGKLTPRQTLLELEYYTRFPRGIVIQALKTYLALPPGQQYGEQYARGIMRNERGNNSTPIETPTKVVPPSNHEAEKEKAEWVRSRLGQYLKSEEEFKRQIEELEAEYDKQKAT